MSIYDNWISERPHICLRHFLWQWNFLKQKLNNEYEKISVKDNRDKEKINKKIVYSFPILIAFILYFNYTESFYCIKYYRLLVRDLIMKF